VNPDDIQLLNNVQQMYQTIWQDGSKNAKKTSWASIKKKNILAGPPGGPDLTILSTAANLAKNTEVELFTFDHDFITFAQEIDSTFNVLVFDGWQL